MESIPSTRSTMKIRTAALVSLALLLWTSLASAGILTVRDSTGYVPQGDVSALARTLGAAAPTGSACRTA